MTNLWFDPSMYGWLPGTAFGVLAGIWGALLGVLGPRGKAKPLVVGMWMFLVTCAVLFLCAGIVALLQRQPYGVWYGLLLPGVIGLLSLPWLFVAMRVAYRQAEIRRMESRDF